LNGASESTVEELTTFSDANMIDKGIDKPVINTSFNQNNQSSNSTFTFSQARDGFTSVANVTLPSHRLIA
jgi:hypothetical protein